MNYDEEHIESIEERLCQYINAIESETGFMPMCTICGTVDRPKYELCRSLAEHCELCALVDLGEEDCYTPVRCQIYNGDHGNGYIANDLKLLRKRYTELVDHCKGKLKNNVLSKLVKY